MNIYTLTGKILKQPRLLRYNKKALTKVFICVPNNKRGVPFYNIKAHATGKMGMEIFDVYRKGDFVIIEGFINIKIKKITVNDKYIKTIKSIHIKINRIHPASLIFT